MKMKSIVATMTILAILLGGVFATQTRAALAADSVPPALHAGQPGYAITYNVAYHVLSAGQYECTYFDPQLMMRYLEVYRPIAHQLDADGVYYINNSGLSQNVLVMFSTHNRCLEGLAKIILSLDPIIVQTPLPW